MSIKILSLFPEELSSSGDSGNLQVLEYRLRARGQDVEVVTWNGAGAFPSDVDAVVIGNGPWSAAHRLIPLIDDTAPILQGLRDAGVVFFAVGTGAELLSSGGFDADGVAFRGAGVFHFSTRRDADRRVGYMRVTSAVGELIGFGDFASLWHADADDSWLGQAVVGDRPSQAFSEGSRTANALATRLGGPALPLNPDLADALISLIMSRRGIAFEAIELPVDVYARNARALIRKNIDSVFTTIAL